MAPLQLCFFGPFQVTRDARSITAFESDKGRALLAYLAVEAAQAHPRSTLTALLWPDYEETSARGSLRQALYQLRQLLGAAGDTTDFLLTTRQTLQFNTDAPYHCDVSAFASLLQRCASHAHPHLAQCPPCLAQLRQAVDLYRGEFLAGFAIDDSAPFEEWRRLKQEQFHLQALDALTILADADEAAGALDGARQSAQRQLALEPWREEAHRQLMRLLARQGQRAAAVAQYQHCRQILAEELGIEPGAATTTLYEQIRAGKEETPPSAVAVLPSRQPQPTQPPAPAPLYDWGEMPALDFFAGRVEEVADLQRWLTPEADAGGPAARLIALLGLGGMGKTTLAARVAQTIAPAYEVVIWRSLLNAPPLNELLGNWLQLLSHQSVMTLPASLDEQLRLLLTYLRQARCLLVLDNVESILAAGERANAAGKTRPGYEGYDQLFQQVGGSEHRSCLLLTSREQPYALLRLVRQAQPTSGRVRALTLAGLDLAASQTLVQSSGLTAPTPAITRLVNIYSGNPLALQIVATTIHDFFAGDIEGFLQQEGIFFDGIRAVLDQQFARLSPLEHEVLVWLAIEREAIAVPLLRHNLLPSGRDGPTGGGDLLEALHALQQRSLIVKSDQGLTLQNVIIEYTTHYLVEQVYREIYELQVANYELRKALPDEEHVTRNSKFVTSFLNRFALVKAQAKEYVRQSQVRLILQPLAEQLVAQSGPAAVVAQVQQILATLRATPPRAGYAAGNCLNLLRYLQVDLTGFDLSQLALWQADLRGLELPAVNLAGSDLRTTLFTGAFRTVHCVAFSGDQHYLATGSADGTLRLWRTEDWQPQQALVGHTAGLWAVAFSPARLATDNCPTQLLASGGEDQMVRIWDVEGGRLLYGLPHPAKVESMAFAPLDAAQPWLATGCWDHRVRLWDTQRGELVATLSGHTDMVQGVAFSPDGTLLASGGWDRTVRLWRTSNGELLHTWHGHSHVVKPVAFSPDGALLASGSWDRTVCLWEVSTGRLLHTLPHDRPVATLAFSADGTLLATAGDETIIRLWDVQSGQNVRILSGHTSGIGALACSAAHDFTLVSCSGDQSVRVWDMHTGRLLRLLMGHADRIHTVAVAPSPSAAIDAPVKLISSGDGNEARCWEFTANGDYRLCYRLQGHSDTLGRVVITSSDGQWIASGSLDQTICIWHASTGKLHRRLIGHTDGIQAIAFCASSPHSPALSPLLLASGGNDQQVRIWEVASGRCLQTFAAGVSALAFQSHGTIRLLAGGGSEKVVELWDADSGHLIHTLTGHTNVIRTLAFSPDGTLLASGSWDQTIRLWDTDSGECVRLLDGHTSNLHAVAFSPDGQLLASAGEDSSIHLWQVTTGQLVASLTGHANAVEAVAFLPPQQGAIRLVSGSADETIKVWEVLLDPNATRQPTKGKCIATIQAAGPYASMNITGVTGISAAQKAALKALGAVEV